MVNRKHAISALAKRFESFPTNSQQSHSMWLALYHGIWAAKNMEDSANYTDITAHGLADMSSDMAGKNAAIACHYAKIALIEQENPNTLINDFDSLRRMIYGESLDRAGQGVIPELSKYDDSRRAWQRRHGLAVA